MIGTYQWRARAQMLTDHHCRVGIAKWGRAGEQVKCARRQCILIGATVDLLTHQLLGRGVRHGSECHVCSSNTPTPRIGGDRNWSIPERRVPQLGWCPATAGRPDWKCSNRQTRWPRPTRSLGAVPEPAAPIPPGVWSLRCASTEPYRSRSVVRRVRHLPPSYRCVQLLGRCSYERSSASPVA